MTIPSTVNSIRDWAFSYCTGLTSVIIPSSVTYIGWTAFRGCTGLTSVTISEGITGIGSGALDGCTGLKSVTIPSSVTRIENRAFSGCSGFISISVDEDNPTYDSRNNCNAIIETKSNTLLLGCKNTIIPSSVTKMTYLSVRLQARTIIAASTWMRSSEFLPRLKP